jgi:hypothetical protein
MVQKAGANCYKVLSTKMKYPCESDVYFFLANYVLFSVFPETGHDVVATLLVITETCTKETSTNVCIFLQRFLFRY